MANQRNIKLIPLTQGKFAIVDAEDYEMLTKNKWHCRRDNYAGCSVYQGFVNGKTNNKSILMHRIVMNAPQDMDVDHINGDTLDNRKCNLRLCTTSQNMQNRKKKTGVATSRHKGVCWVSDRRRWKVSIRANNNSIHLGYFASEFEAAVAYNVAAKKYFGEFAALNTI